ncbi:MAG: hypothetical protein JST06_00495 [Bacteroidetes bacterium]|nr:hypothetical protein [Bacteroidota bacterium]MBS1630010.1 hypothetical protein [Bacteroidota bacterium]
MNTANKQPAMTADAFPGYPPYPAEEDITKHNQRVELDKLHRPEESAPDSLKQETELPSKPASHPSRYDVSPEESALLDAAFQNRRLSRPDLEDPLLDTTDPQGTALNEQHPPYNQEGSDLDVPGAESDDADEAIGEEDEENNYYSLGQDSLPEHEADEDL